MNKKITSTAILILALATFAPDSFAAFDQYKMVGALNDTAEKTVFGFDETPYLYLKLPANGQAFTGSFWRDPDAAYSYTSTSGTNTERWISLTNWNSVKKVGDWEVNSNYFYTNGNTGSASASFTVTPEPLAMTLFLLGGTPIAVNIYRKHRQVKD